jgi:tetratricopeptide (TPR) repeat protein
MRLPCFFLVLLAVAGFSLATVLEPALEASLGRRESASLLQTALGDGRKLFAHHFFTKADVYFHNGYYPTIYDQAEDFHRGHNPMAGREGGDENGHPEAAGQDGHEAHKEHEEHERENFLGQPKDWIDAFSRHFYPSHHTHLGDCDDASCPEHGHGTAHGEHAASGDEKEILPWLRLSAELDPQRVETYVVASYWLRSKLGKVEEAERFLREGLQANPGSPDILFELGRIYYDDRHDAGRARNVWELALRYWRQRQAGQAEPDQALGASILNQLALLEREQNNYPRAIEHYTALREISPNTASIQAWIDYLKTNGPPVKVGHRQP